jgi:hypothetical protein
VEGFVDFLIDRRVYHPKGKMKLSWEGALADLRDQHSSVDLQLRFSNGGATMYLVDTNLILEVLLNMLNPRE